MYLNSKCLEIWFPGYIWSKSELLTSRDATFAQIADTNPMEDLPGPNNIENNTMIIPIIVLFSVWDPIFGLFYLFRGGRSQRRVARAYWWGGVVKSRLQERLRGIFHQARKGSIILKI